MKKTENKSKNTTTTTTLYPYQKPRSPIKDIEGDKHSLGIMLMDAEVLHKCRVLSGEGEEYEHEYAVWYSSHDIHVTIGKQTFTVSRPYSFYNINQVTGTASVEYEAEDRLMLNEIEKELMEQYQNTLINSEEVTSFHRRVTEIIKKYYALSFFNNDLTKFVDAAKAELHITQDLIDSLTDVATKKALEGLDKPFENQEDFNLLVEDIAYDMAIDKLLEDGYEPNPEITDEQIHEVCIDLAIMELEADNYIFNGIFGDMSEEEQKDVVDNNKMVIASYLSKFHTFHAHPKGVNSFSGTIGGKSGDLMNKYTEEFNRETGEWEQSADAETGIVYQFVQDVNSNPLPSFSGVVQQINKATTLIFNELRMWQCVKDGDYTYARTPALTYVKGFAPEVEEEELPIMARMLGKEVPKIPDHDYVIPFMGQNITPMTDEIFEVYLDTPFEVLYDIDENRISQKTYSSNHYYYGGAYYNSSSMKTWYPIKNKMVEWLMKHTKLLKEKGKNVTKKSLGRLSNKNLQKLVDLVCVNSLFSEDSKNTRKYTKTMNKVFHLFDEDFFDFVDNYQNNYEFSKKVATFFITTELTEWGWGNIHKKGIKLFDVIDMSTKEIKEASTYIAATTTTTSTTNTNTIKENWPLSDWDVQDILADLNESTTGTEYSRLARLKELLFTTYNIPQADRYRVWMLLESYDIEIDSLFDDVQYQYNVYIMESLSNSPFTAIEVDSLIALGYTTEELLWLDKEEAEKLLIKERRKGNLKYVKTKASYSTYLQSRAINTVVVGDTTYGVNASLAKDAVEEKVKELLEAKIKETLFSEDDIKQVMEDIETLDLDLVNLMKSDKFDEIISHIFLNNEIVPLYAKYVSPYTQDASMVLEYSIEDLLALDMPEKEVTVFTHKDMNTVVTVPLEKARKILNEFGVTRFTTKVGKSKLNVGINETNMLKALTDLVLSTLCVGLSKEEANKVIRSINLIGVDLDDLMSMPAKTCDVYIEKFIEFNPTKEQIAAFGLSDDDWRTMLESVTPEDTEIINYTDIPWEHLGQYYDEIDNKTITITYEEYITQCKARCVIQSIAYVGSKRTATLNSGFSVNLSATSDKKLGDIVYPIL